MKLPCVKIGLIPVIVLLLSACTSTTLDSRWHDPVYAGQPLQRMLVIGIMKDDVTRRAFEDGFASRLAGHALSAIPSYQLMPEIRSVDDRDEIAAVVEQAAADSVIIATLKGVSKEERVVPPSVDYVPSIGFGYGMYGYYGMSHQAVYRPGYTTIDTVVHLETRVFAASSEKLVWAGNTKSFNPASAQTVISEVASLVVTDMQKSGLLK